MAQLGRWIVRDPIEEVGGINIYSFLLNNPISKWDYLGFYDDDLRHFDDECKKSKTCEENVNILLNNITSAYQRFQDFSPDMYQKAILGETIPVSERYRDDVTTYDVSWNNHRTPLKKRLKRTAKCIKILKNQYDDGECDCCNGFFRDKKLLLITYEYERMMDNFPGEVRIRNNIYDRIMPTKEQLIEAAKVTGEVIVITSGTITAIILGALGCGA